MEKNNKLVVLDDVKMKLANEYNKQIVNFFGDQKQALKFLSSVVSSIQRTPGLSECTPDSLINSFIIMAQFGFMPSAVSGEAYVLPYKDGKSGCKIAQFQMGYQGFVTLLYGAGAKSVVAEIVRKNDEFSIVNGAITHVIDPYKSRSERGEPMGAYAIITTQKGGRVEKFMRKDEILSFAQRFSKSFGTDFSPWNEKNDPEGWMWKKTALKQAQKLAPKNEMLNLAIAYDNEDSVMSDRIKEAKELSTGIKMGALVEGKGKKVSEKKHDENQENEANIITAQTAEDLP
jgi:recombination protein RecT